MSEGKRNLVSCFGSSSVKKWNFESDSKKRRIEDEKNSSNHKSSDSVFHSNQNHDDDNEYMNMTSTQKFKSDEVDLSSKSKYIPKPAFTAPLNSIIDKKLAEESLKTDDDELNSIDAYFASLEKKNEPYQRPRPPAGFRYLLTYIHIFLQFSFHTWLKD